MDTQTVIVLLIVGVSAWLVLKKLIKAAKNGDCGCNGGCGGGCGGASGDESCKAKGVGNCTEGINQK